MLIGIAVGIPGTYAVMKGLSNLLFGVAPFDVRTIAASALVLTVITVAATLVPARRAGAIDPQECLRCS
jgi:ABC-type antimicrobial peptide transport system permease subunit